MRTQLNNAQINKGVEKVLEKLFYRLDQKGYGTFASRHEILGVVSEEFKEFVDAVHSKDYENMKDELIDIAVACIFGLVCLEEETVEW
jgi:NTP pyrophosphatase (non-canonical NTP hydrolase)